MVEFRIARDKDSRAIAKLHYICAQKQIDGFMHKLGVSFLNQYYKVFIKEKNSLIIIAEDNGEILGFHSGTMSAEEHHNSLKKYKFILGFSMFFALISNLKLLGEIIKRYRSLDSKENDFRVKTGPRGEYWAWSPGNKDSSSSLKLHKTWHDILRDLGANYVRSEVDLTNTRIVRSIKHLGGIFLQEIELPDGRKRAIVEYKL
ncbi:MAG: hypothetical protein AB9846_10555 [Tenuifilaceae bacterium]